jgi:hypothetical protein
MKRFIRCEYFIMLALAIAAIIAATVHMPYVEKLVSEGRNLYGFWALQKRTAEIKAKKNTVQREIRLLDSLAAVYEKRMQGDEGAAAAMLYKQAEAAGLRTSRISIGDKLKVENRDETSVTVRGHGSYSSLGRFCEAVENLPAPVRIRQITASAAGSGRVDAVIDFALLSEHQTNKEK